MNYAPLLVGLLAAVSLLLVFIGGALLGYNLAGRTRYDEGRRAGYDEGYAAMKKTHEQYRQDNRAALAAIQALTPNTPTASLGPSLEQPRAFDTSGGFDCSVITNRGMQAVGRGRTLEDARAAAVRVLERAPQWREVVITRPGLAGARVEVERVRTNPGALNPVETERTAPPAPCGALFGFRGTNAHCALPAGHAGEHDLTPDA